LLRNEEEERKMRVLLEPEAAELEKICELPPEAALRRAAPYLARLVSAPGFLEGRLAHIPDQGQDAREDWFVAERYNAPDRSYSLQLFLWPPGSGTNIHDHSCWGAFLCVAGAILEERYERLDDGSVAEHARLKKLWELMWRREDGVSGVLAGDGGIHRVSNPGEEVALSVHLYGPRLGQVEGRDYDPSRDYVCDRRD
jgi:predicted metal-dependent enzyme (double-stranded beta helix superfamily)